MVDAEGGDVFLLLPLVLLEGGASGNGRGANGPRLTCSRAPVGTGTSKTVLPTGGRSPSKGTMSEQVLEESSPFLVDFGLADQGAKLFFTGTEMFVTFTLFSQSVR